MTKKRILIAVKTYPTLSAKYDELVCTAGFTEDGGWIRLYPIPFRKLNYISRYRKYDWVEMDLTRNTSDFRPESYRPVNIDVDDPVRLTGHVDTRNNWAERKKFALKNTFTDFEKLIAMAKDKKICTSLATFKPHSIKDFVFEAVNPKWNANKLQQLQQMKLFQPEKPFEVIPKLPYKFSYVFQDMRGKIHKMMIEDWETGALYWKCLAKYEGDETVACAEVKAKYLDDFAKTKDLYFFLGTTKVNHFLAKNPFIILGTFHPKKEQQLTFEI